MKDISISFSADELKTLVSMAFVGEYVLESGDDAPSAECYAVMQKILAAGRDAKAIDDIGTSEIDGTLLVPLETEAELVSIIDEYDEAVFFEALLDELVSNEIEQKTPPRILANLSEERYSDMCAELEKKYVEEFQNNGYKNLTIPGLK